MNSKASSQADDQARASREQKSFSELSQLSFIEQVQWILGATPVAVLMVDGDGRIRLANEVASLLFGYERGELEGQAIESLVPARFHPVHEDHRARYYDDPQSRPMGKGRDLFALRKDGSELPVEIGLHPIHSEQQVFILSTIIDLTERKRLEATLRDWNERLEASVQERTAELLLANEELERSNLELQRFAYLASHDLQAPLRSISGFVQLLQRKYDDQLDDQARSWIHRTVDAVQSMHALLLDLLAYTRLDFDPRTYSIVDSADLLHNVLGLLETQIQNTQAQIKSEAMPKIWGDRSQLLVLFQNLISNAIKFRTDQAPRIHLSARKQADGWLFSVRDEGLGIDPAYQKGIFEPFRRLSHQQDRYPGTGMGLAVCRRIVENHRGRIWFDSQPGRGSTFYFTLPANLEDMQT